MKTIKYITLILAKLINKTLLILSKNYIFSNFIFIGIVGLILVLTGLITLKSPQNFIIVYAIVFFLCSVGFNSDKAKVKRNKSIVEIETDLKEIENLLKNI